jgi:hypothetical protein
MKVISEERFQLREFFELEFGEFFDLVHFGIPSLSRKNLITKN